MPDGEQRGEHPGEQLWLQGIVGPAREVISTDATKVRVSAGPGTGKTFALMRRVARLLGEEVAPERILVVTFTRTAARDLVDGLRDLKLPGARNVCASTLHSYCFSVLAREAVLETTGRVPRPLLRHEVRVMQEDLRHAGFGIRETSDMLKAFAAAWARLQSEEPGWPQNARERQFLAGLQAWLRFHKAMLLEELVIELRRYLRDNPGVPELAAFDHVCVDEYQDLNRADQDVLLRLSAAGKLMVIGDEDQSIYTSLRYAQPEGIRNFPQEHAPVEDIPLAQCRRCPTRVVAVANHLIANNADRAPRILEPFPGNPEGRLTLIQWQSMEAEASGLAEAIATEVNSGRVAPGKVLVLAPRKPVGYEIRNRLTTAGVSAHSFFTEEALDEAVSQEQLSLLMLLVNPLDRVALRFWVGCGHNTMAAAGYARIRQKCEADRREPRDVIADIAAGVIAIPYTDSIVQRFRLLQERLAPLNGLLGQELVDVLFPAGTEELDALRTAACAVIEDAEDPDVTAQTLLSEVRERVVQPELPQEGDYVRIMSLHKCKGLTAELVIIASCVEGWIPTLDDRATDAEAALREQRRLFYVAITRPTRHLVASSFLTMPLYLAHKQRVTIARQNYDRALCVASRFLAELGPNAPAPFAAQAGWTLPT